MKVLRVYFRDSKTSEFDFAEDGDDLVLAIRSLEQVVAPIRTGDGQSSAMPAAIWVSLPGFLAWFRSSEIIGYSVIDYDSPAAIADTVKTRAIRERVDKQIEDEVAEAKRKAGF